MHRLLARGAFALLAISLAACASFASPDAAIGEDCSFRNPVISGFAPDPSIVRVGDDFYLVTSSFEYFPALPIYHSTDLVNWTLISHALPDSNNLRLSTLDSSRGIHAATIRHHNGLFYVVSTNIADQKPESFVVTASDPRGPWSDAMVIKDAVGIDPALFFDDDGRAWYTANWAAPDPEFPGQALIWIQEFNLDTLQLIGERRFVWSGCCRGVWAEGPRIYKRGGKYYLMISEGGTSFEHAVSIAVSDHVQGPYEGNPRNPILTHRQLSFDHPITGVGHADLVELADGRWYGVALGWRLLDSEHGMLGRETFLFPVVWETEREWWKDDKKTFPVMSPASGKVDASYPMPFKGAIQRDNLSFVDDFDHGTLSPHWNFRRPPAAPFYELRPSQGALRLNLKPTSIAENERYAFMGVRQTSVHFEAETEMRFSTELENEEAGLVVMQNDRAALTFTINGDAERRYAILSKWLYGERTELARTIVDGDDLRLRVSGDRLDYSFYVAGDDDIWFRVGEIVDARFLSPAVLRGFNYTGLYVGLYGSSNGLPSDAYADFSRFSYSPQTE